MIAIDTSALMAIVGDEPTASACKDRLDGETRVIISAATLAESFIVAMGRGVNSEMALLIDLLAPEIEPVTAAAARRVAAIYARWGKGIHPARLNFCDCFAYDAAYQNGIALLYVGNDFALTDIKGAL